MTVDKNVLWNIHKEDIVDGTFIIPENVKRILYLACGYNEKLEYIEIPDSVIQIEQAAFYSCYNLKYVKLPKNLLEIERGTFDGCHSLKKIIFPDNLQKIGKEAFQYCHSLGDFVLPRVITIEQNAFNSCTNLRIFLDSDAKYATLYVQKNKIEIKNDNEEELYISKAIGYIHNNVFGNCDDLEVYLDTSLISTSDICYLMEKVKHLYINGISVKADDSFNNKLRKIREKEIKEKIEFELIKNNLFDKKYLNDPEHKRIIKTIIDFYEMFDANKLYDYKNRLNKYIKNYIEKNKNNIVQLCILNNNSLEETLEKLNDYNVLNLKINTFTDISNYGNDLLEYSCYITDVYYNIVSKYGNDIFVFKTEKLLGKINRFNISFVTKKIDDESIKYLKLFSKYKINQDIEEIKNLQLLKEIIKIYITKVNECLNNLLNYNHNYNISNILFQSDNNTINQIMNDKINSLKNNIAIMIEYYKRIDLMIQSNNLYISRLDFVNKQLHSTNLLQNKKIESKELNEVTNTLNEVITVDKDKKKDVVVSTNTINNLDEEIKEITSEQKKLTR